MAQRLIPYGSRITVRKDANEDRTTGGIILPSQVMNPPQTGIVIDVGPGQFSDVLGKHIPIRVEKGDRIAFTQVGGKQIDVGIGKDEIFVLTENEILGVFKDLP